MWTFSELKSRALVAFKANYWSCVLVAFLISLVTGGTANSFNFTKKWNSGSYNNEYSDTAYMTKELLRDMSSYILPIILGVVLVTVIGIAISILLQSFVFDFIQIGGAGFFLNNRHGKAQVKDILAAFNTGYYKKNANILLKKNISVFLWSLLFIIPGIIKSLEYSMIPYILAEYPDLDSEQVFALSKQLTDGRKWTIFLFNLSFILWYLLGGITLGLAIIFWVAPYVNAANAELYAQIYSDQYPSIQSTVY